MRNQDRIQSTSLQEKSSGITLLTQPTSCQIMLELDWLMYPISIVSLDPFWIYLNSKEKSPSTKLNSWSIVIMSKHIILKLVMQIK